MSLVKTNAIRMLDQAKIEYLVHEYKASSLDGLTVATTLGVEPKRVFKTLVTVANTKEYYVFMIPVNHELDLKKVAKLVGVKELQMIKQNQLLPLTGYVHGGCSPLAMKKNFATYIDSSAQQYDSILFSAGKIGLQIEANYQVLVTIVSAKLADLTK